MNLFIEKLTQYQDNIALIFDESRYSYAQLTAQIKNHIIELNEIKSGSMVALIGDYSFKSIALFLALATKKCVIVPIVSQNEEEILKRLEVVKPEHTISCKNETIQLTHSELNEKPHQLIKQIITHKHAGLVLFSSGSTGTPKAMIHDLDILLETYLNKRVKSLTIMVFLMFDHIGGLNTLLNSLSMGAKIVIPSKREPELVAKLIESEKINLLPASPTFLSMMLITDVVSNYNLKSLRMITYGTEAMPESLLLRLKQAMPRVKLLQTFGTSETGIAQTSSRSSNSLEIKFDDPNQEYKIVNNELWLRSKTQILGYLNHNMDSFSQDGWFKTGDLVKETSDGYLQIIGRIKEVINVGGEKVLPSEVESVVLTVSGVMDCTAYAAPNSITGQTVAVNVVISEDTDFKALKKLIRKQCIAVLDPYKVPTKMNFSQTNDVGERFKKIRANL